MTVNLKKWREDEGGIDFVQLIVGLMIIGIAAIATFDALHYGYEQLDYQMRYRKAISIARSYAEYWQGRVHTDFDPRDPGYRAMLAGNLNHPETVLLDERDPEEPYDDITAKLSYGRLVPVDLQTTGLGIDHWKIRVYLTWHEPWEDDRSERIHEIFLDATMVPSAM